MSIRILAGPSGIEPSTPAVGMLGDQPEWTHVWQRDGRIELQPLAQSICFRDSAEPSSVNPLLIGGA